MFLLTSAPIDRGSKYWKKKEIYTMRQVKMKKSEWGLKQSKKKQIVEYKKKSPSSLLLTSSHYKCRLKILRNNWSTRWDKLKWRKKSRVGFKTKQNQIAE